jgi:hypothetical protein
MNTRRGFLILLGSMAISGVATYFLRPYLPDEEVALFTFLAACAASAIVAEGFWRVEQPPMTGPQGVLLGTWWALLAVYLMWTPLPVEQDLPRTMSVLPWRFYANQLLAAALAVAFAVWTVLVHRFYEGLERRVFRGLGLTYVGLAVLDGFFFGRIHPIWPIGLLLFTAGFLGPDLPWMLKSLLRRRRRDVFGSARFEEDRGAAGKGGLQ